MKQRQKYRIRPIAPADDPHVEAVIRSCLIEFGANHAGTAWADPDLSRFSTVYDPPGRQYWVLENAKHEIVGGVGIGELPGQEGICELQKMYCLPSARGSGAAQALMDTALHFAAEHYDGVYLETLENMLAAQRFYEKNGFSRLDHPLGNTGHFSCDVCYFRGFSKTSNKTFRKI